MFEFDSKHVDAVAAKVKAMVREEFKDVPYFSEYAISAVIGKLFDYEHDISAALDHFYAAKATPLVNALVTLHDALKAKGHDVTNTFEIGSCDRYAAFVPYGDGSTRVLAFCNQNVTYMVALVPAKAWVDKDVEGGETVTTIKKDGTPFAMTTFDTFTMHIRIITPGKNSRDIMAVDLANVNYEKHLAGCDKDRYSNESSDYFMYRDARDRGFVMTLEPETFLKYHDAPFFKAKDMGAAHPSAPYVLNELEGYESIMDEILEEITEGAE